jgi:hypothetical protein
MCWLDITALHFILLPVTIIVNIRLVKKFPTKAVLSMVLKKNLPIFVKTDESSGSAHMSELCENEYNN